MGNLRTYAQGIRDAALHDGFGEMTNRAAEELVRKHIDAVKKVIGERPRAPHQSHYVYAWRAKLISEIWDRVRKELGAEVREGDGRSERHEDDGDEG
jgi:hypothetical protein